MSDEFTTPPGRICPSCGASRQLRGGANNNGSKYFYLHCAACLKNQRITEEAYRKFPRQFFKTMGYDCPKCSNQLITRGKNAGYCTACQKCWSLNLCKGIPMSHIRGNPHAKAPPKKTNTSGFKGVSLHRQSGKYTADISQYGKRYHLGLFDTAEQAAAAYNAKAYELFGDLAYQNPLSRAGLTGFQQP